MLVLEGCRRCVLRFHCFACNKDCQISYSHKLPPCDVSAFYKSDGMYAGLHARLVHFDPLC